MKTYDAIVIGVGGVGSAAAYHLAERGLRVLGLDRFAPGHDRGSSHGQTRIIRKAYFEHPNYVPLLNQAYDLWAQLESRYGQQLYFPVGLLEVGPPDGVVVPGVLEAARQHRLPVEEVSDRDFSTRFPDFILPAGSAAVFEEDAGYLLVEKCVTAHAALARQSGAEILSDVTVQAWNADAREITVSTSTGRYSAANLIVTAGAWARDLLNQIRVPLRVLRKHLHWYAAAPGRYAGGCPGFFYEVDGAYFYGFPVIDDRGVKVAEHSGGDAAIEPLNDPREIDDLDRGRVEAFLQPHLPHVTRRHTDHTVCFYCVSPDEHFIVDRHPEYPHVAFAAGMSGHGFKFTSVLGEVLADFVTRSERDARVEFLNCQRFA